MTGKSPNLMRKINKTIVLSTKYKEWQEDLESRNIAHPLYTSAHRYYRDIVMELLRCQGGLCAYTEVQLCASSDFAEDKWSDGCYMQIEKVNDGELEHFNEALKDRQGYLWSNLFVVQSDTNRRKGVKPVDDILRPDSVRYDPFQLLDYSSLTGIYTARTNLPENERTRIDTMLDTLGINFPNLRNKRHLKVQAAIRYGVEAIEPEFPTAIEFINRRDTDVVL